MCRFAERRGTGYVAGRMTLILVVYLFHADLRLEKYFKMDLNDTIESAKAFDLVVDFLKCLWEDIRKYVSEVVNKPVSASDIKWCLSIPAIWTDHEKQLMKRVGIIALIPCLHLL